MRLHNLRNLEYNCYKCRSVRFIFAYLKVAIVKIVLDCMVVTQTYIILSRFQSFLNCHAKLYLLLKTSFHVSYEEKMTDSFLQYHYTKRKIQVRHTFLLLKTGQLFKLKVILIINELKMMHQQFRNKTKIIYYAEILYSYQYYQSTRHSPVHICPT